MSEMMAMKALGLPTAFKSGARRRNGGERKRDTTQRYRFTSVVLTPGRVCTFGSALDLVGGQEASEEAVARGVQGSVLVIPVCLHATRVFVPHAWH